MRTRMLIIDLNRIKEFHAMNNPSKDHTESQEQKYLRIGYLRISRKEKKRRKGT